MTLSLTPVDPDSPADIADYCAVLAAVREHDVPLWRENPPRMVELLIRHPFADSDNLFFIARRDGVPVGRVTVDLPLLENLDTLQTDIWVVPSARRQGIGRELWEFVQRLAGTRQRKKVLTSTLWDLPGIPAPDLAGPAFARALGFKPSLVDVARRLDLSTVDESVLDAMSNPAEGYRVVRWQSPHPDEYLADVAYLDSRLATDAPMGDLEWEPPKPDKDRMRRVQATLLARERLGYHTGAVHMASGRLVAWTTIAKEKSLDWNAFQQITIVDPDHRGHRLGALVKAENLRYFRKHEPTVTTIDTFNAESNRFMIAINEQMGFRTLYAWQNWQREI
jgi:GNAT superfamily N-acetyltransferase